MIRIVTDSTCEAPPDLLRNPAVTVVPLHVIFGQDSYQDNIEMTREQFWARLPESDKLPTTSQVTPAQFEVPFKAFTDAGDEVIAITLSAKLSRTYESALLAKDSMPSQAIDVVDSKSISVGLGLVVQKAVEMASAGSSPPKSSPSSNKCVERCACSSPYRPWNTCNTAAASAKRRPSWGPCCNSSRC